MSDQFLPKLFGLSGQTAVVIGGAGVLGGALCRGLVGAQAAVMVADVTEEGCQARVKELERLGGRAAAGRVDVTSRDSIDRLLEQAVDWAGRVNILVNSAGVNFGSTYLEATDEAWDRVMTINLKAVFQACQIFGRHMVSHGGGSILNIGSVTSHLPLSKVFAYSCSKAGVVNLTRNVAREFGKHNVRCNAICPGFFPAEQNRRLLDEERIDNIMRHTPMGRYGEPDELVGAMLLLVSPGAASFITGSIVNVDGGFTAAWF
jgi:NAD(P)-dependent dehydrogenase (short-subunit alcohol dehydrogenase family)